MWNQIVSVGCTHCGLLLHIITTVCLPGRKSRITCHNKGRTAHRCDHWRVTRSSCPDVLFNLVCRCDGSRPRLCGRAPHHACSAAASSRGGDVVIAWRRPRLEARSGGKQWARLWPIATSQSDWQVNVLPRELSSVVTQNKFARAVCAGRLRGPFSTVSGFVVALSWQNLCLHSFYRHTAEGAKMKKKHEGDGYTRSHSVIIPDVAGQRWCDWPKARSRYGLRGRPLKASQNIKVEMMMRDVVILFVFIHRTKK